MKISTLVSLPLSLFLRLLLPLILPLSLFLTSCSTTSSGPLFESSQVLDRMGDLSKSPEWATGAKPITEEGGNVIYTSVLILSGDARPDACMRMAEEQSRGRFLREIKDQIATTGQVNEIDAESDPAWESLSTFAAKGQLSGARTTERFWERKVQSDGTGNRILKLHCASRVAIRREILQKQINDVLRNSKGNPVVREKLQKFHEDYLDGLTESH